MMISKANTAKKAHMVSLENYFVRRSALMKSPGMKRSPLWLQA